ncbi:MAG TPA: Nramp family divalent metal transporter [Vicinamibacterales bacterium]
MNTPAARPQVRDDVAAGVHRGSTLMPPWRVGELPPPPVWTPRHWRGIIGPGLIMAGAAVGGGEWLLGPRVGAQYGGALLWVATLSLACQFVYNVEASRYTLYTGESILTGAFRTRPGPRLWFWLYLLLDFGALLPYQTASVATPIAAIYLAHIPNPSDPVEASLLRTLTYVMLALALLPLVFGGKVYNAIRILMTTKIVVVFGFLAFLAIVYSSWATWADILTGLLRFGTLPAADSGTVNVFASLWHDGRLPEIDRDAIAILTAFAAIAGVGGLQQTSISNYTREQGWGMGGQVGAIPSLVGGRRLRLFHGGTVFQPGPEAQTRWAGWLHHVRRDQLAIWLPAAIIGLALPTMLSIEFLPRGTQANQWVLAGMTADGIAARIGGTFGAVAWYLVLLCGFLVLFPSSVTAADGFLRRWLDVGWTGLPLLRRMDPHHIRYVYFAALVVYFIVGLVFLSIAQPLALIILYGNLGNFALGVSCFHTIHVNRTLLPPELQPGPLPKIGLALAGMYYLVMAGVTGGIVVGIL